MVGVLEGAPFLRLLLALHGVCLAWVLQRPSLGLPLCLGSKPAVAGAARGAWRSGSGVAGLPLPLRQSGRAQNSRWRAQTAAPFIPRLPQRRRPARTAPFRAASAPAFCTLGLGGRSVLLWQLLIEDRKS